MVEYFFPNQAPELIALEGRLRQIAATLSEHDQHELYEVLTALAPDLPNTKFKKYQDLVIVQQLGRELAFPSPMPLVKLGHVSCGYISWLTRKYELPGFVSVEAGDITVDCGAYVGGFAMGAAEKSSEVHVFEPEKKNFECAARNWLLPET
ncbi:MAG: hypothetical protein R3D67_07570 [Hyphomicrobiaceae bacterium]